MLRTITEISEIKAASNKNTYIVLTFAPSIEDEVLHEGAVKAFFGDKALLKQVKVGMQMAID